MSAPTEIEFKIGDRVTYHPYEKALPATVTKVLPDYWGQGRTFYAISGHRVKAMSPGQCIVESKHFGEPAP